MYKIKFSPSISKGTAQWRRDKARSMSLDFVEQVSNSYSKETLIPVRSLERMFKKFMPEKIFFSVKKMTKEQSSDFGGLTDVLFFNNAAFRYLIFMPAENNALKLEDLPAFAHEATHFFDYLLSPKSVRTFEKVYGSDLDEYANEVYKSFFYDASGREQKGEMSLSELKKVVREKLQNFSNEQKIDILNYIKEGIESEINAYTAENICGNKLLAKKKKSSYCHYEEMESIYGFNEKLEMIKNLLYKTIVQTRCINSLNNAQNPMDKLKFMIKYCLNSLI